MNPEKILNFKKYYPKNKRLKIPAITVRTNRLVFNYHCLPYFNKKDYAELYYDKKNKVIAIKPYHLDNPSCVPILGLKTKRTPQNSV